MRRASSPSTGARFSVGGIVEVCGHDGDADIGFEQFDQVAFRGNLVAALDLEPVLAQRSVQPLRMFAIISRQQLLGPQILEVDGVAARPADAAC